MSTLFIRPTLLRRHRPDLPMERLLLAICTMRSISGNDRDTS